MGQEDDFTITERFKNYYTLTKLKTEETEKSSKPSFKAYLIKDNIPALLKCLSFASIVTPLAIAGTHLVSSIAATAKYGFEIAVFKLIVPSQIISVFSDEIREYIDKCKKNCSVPNWKQTFTTEDGVQLEGAYLKRKEGQSGGKTLIYFGGNGDHFATELSSPLTEVFLEKGYNIILFNYRGVGESTGHVTKEGLFKDADCVYQFARDQGCEDCDILLFGHSLGAGVASHLALNHPDVNFCHERSFTSLDKAAESLVTNFLGGSRAAQTAGKIAGAAIRRFGFNIDTTEGFNKIAQDNRLVVYHPEDQIINEASSMHAQLDETKDPIKILRRQRRGEDPHNREITRDEAELIYLYFNLKF